LTDRQKIKDTLRSYISQNFMMFAAVESFRDSDSFLELGIIDSTGILELLQFVEETFGVHVEDDETVPENLDSLDCLSAFILKKAEGGRVPAGPAGGRPLAPGDVTD